MFFLFPISVNSPIINTVYQEKNFNSSKCPLTEPSNQTPNSFNFTSFTNLSNLSFFTIIYYLSFFQKYPQCHCFISYFSSLISLKFQPPISINSIYWLDSQNYHLKVQMVKNDRRLTKVPQDLPQSGSTYLTSFSTTICPFVLIPIFYSF